MKMKLGGRERADTLSGDPPRTPATRTVRPTRRGRIRRSLHQDERPLISPSTCTTPPAPAGRLRTSETPDTNRAASYVLPPRLRAALGVVVMTAATTGRA